MGSYDSLVITAKPIYEEAVLDEDWDIALHSSIMIAQAYLFTEDADSVYRWLDIAESLGVENAEVLMKVVPSDDNVIIPWKETGMSEKEQPRDPILNRFDTSTWGRATNVSKGVELHIPNKIK